MIGTIIKMTAFLVLAHYVVGFLLKVFSRKSKVYYLAPARQFGMVFWSAIGTWLGASILSLIPRAQTDTLLEKSLAAGIGSALLLFSLPSLFVHFQYWRFEQESALELDTKSGVALLLRPGQRYYLDAAQVHAVQETKCSSNSFFWSPYKYLTLTLADGSQLIITSLLIDVEQLKALWPRAAYSVKTKFICFL
ncbi:hypothetical protein [Nibribacter koreensis]|uniref:PH domain-containing protein n=1 Tax=Nibribacter koreensis TaxID=1084519 RepID=A0ABP8FMX8_9BACT